MAVDIELACNLIQAKIAAQLRPTYVSNVPDVEQYLTSLEDALCPYVMTWPGPGSWAQKGGGYKFEERTFNVFCFVESLAQKDIPSRTHQGIQILQAMRSLFATAGNIQLDDGVTSGYQITVASRVGNEQTDTGLTASLPFSGSPWFGFSIPLKVRIQWILP